MKKHAIKKVYYECGQGESGEKSGDGEKNCTDKVSCSSNNSSDKRTIEDSRDYNGQKTKSYGDNRCAVSKKNVPEQY